MTIKLYDFDSYLTEFDAQVLDCEKCGEQYKIELDKTLFFPEEGGQSADRGTLNGIEITDVKLKDGVIYHYSNYPFTKGEMVHGKIDFDFRFRNMQNHTGEHIISGIAHKLFGYDNVGFHLGIDNVTMDLSGYIEDEDIKKIELLANKAVYENHPVTAYYPSDDELKNLEYRAKCEIKENIRIVEIGNLDLCACCAPHVKNTGEIGIIKILSKTRYKGGVRLNILCGYDALNDYSKKHYTNSLISSLLSVKEDETYDGVKKLLDNITSLNIKLNERTKILAKHISDSVKFTKDNICLFFDGMDNDHLRLIANEIKEKTESFAIILSGDDNDCYRYIIISNKKSAEEFTKKANLSLSGRGGGRLNMATGTFKATKKEIEDYFLNVIE